MRYWINTISRNHVQAGAAGGFTEADHGRETRLKRLAKGDAIVFYSPRTDIKAGERVQRFTGIARIVDDELWRESEQSPWRRRAEFAPAAEAPVAPLIEDLEFIRNKKSWGVVFRRGFFEIGENDFRTIAMAMNANV